MSLAYSRGIMAPGSPEPLSGIDRDAGGLAWTAGESLIRWKAGGGDTEEFERVALVHLDALYHIALRLTRNRAEAEDVVQEAFLRAFRSFHRFNPGTNCRAWLFTILRHVFLNRVRVQGREVLETEMGGLEQVQMTAEAPVGRNPEEQLLQTILHGDVDRALAALPLVFREAVMLVDIEGLTYREVAEVLGCPIGTVMSRLSRGRALLRRTLLRFAREHGYVKEQEGTAWRSRPGFTPTSTVSSR